MTSLTTHIGRASPFKVFICLLGGFRILRDGVPMSLRPGGKVEQVIGSLALHFREGVPRDELLEQVWPASETGLAAQSLNSLSYWLHRELAPVLEGRPAICHQAGRYSLSQDDRLKVDIVEFDAAVDAGNRLGLAGDAPGAIDSYSGAVDLYRGDLDGGSDVRHLLERERLRARYLRTLARIADRYFELGDYQLSLHHALELLKADPCREDAHRMAMRSYVRSGERAQAMRQYQVCRKVLAAEFQALPEPATDSLFELVRSEPQQV